MGRKRKAHHEYSVWLTPEDNLYLERLIARFGAAAETKSETLRNLIRAMYRQEFGGGSHG